MAALPAEAANAKLELAPADAIATVRIMQNQISPGDAVNDATISPDGDRFVVRIAYGDVVRNGVWVDLLTGRLDSLESAAQLRRCGHMFTTGLGSDVGVSGAEFDPHPSNILHWLNDHEVAMLWHDEHRLRQIRAVDLDTCVSRFLTHSNTTVFSFGVAPHGKLIVETQAPRTASSARSLWTSGFTVPDSSDGWAILNGVIDGSNASDLAFNSRWFIQQTSQPPRTVLIAGKKIDPTFPALREIVISPDGRQALIGVGLAVIPDSWSRYTDANLQAVIDVNKTSPGRSPLDYALIDLQSAKSRLLWSVPKGFRASAHWSPRSDAVLIAPTFLPVETMNDAGLAGAGAAEVDVRTGDYRVLPIDLRSRTVTDIAWTSADSAEISSTDLYNAAPRTEYFTRQQGQWRALDGTPPVIRAHDAPRAAVHIDLHQSLNEPPRLFAVDSRTGESELLFDSNPSLTSRFKLGKVERRSGQLPSGKRWIGQLIYPADFVRGRHYPLVIQSIYARPWGDEQFSIDGSWGSAGTELGPSFYAAYPGQLLATRNIAVLELELLHPSRGPQEAPDIQLAFETVAESLVAEGLIDRDKVALDGFSRNGYWVEYTLAHSHFPFAAAVAADNYDPSYFQSALANWRTDDAQMNGAPAFGDGLKLWMARAPGFNVEHIHTPLRIIGQSDGIAMIIAEWEIFSRLRHLNKPVEFYMMPDADRYPSHTPQSPRQIMAIQDGIVDWLTFWLTGREDADPKKRAQYLRWHAFRDLRTASNP